MSDADFSTQGSLRPHGWTPPTVEELQPFFPRLVVEQLLAIGGMSALYLARQPLVDRRVVLKVLPPELGMNLEHSQRFTKEARILGRLRDPGIVEIFDTGLTEGGHLYLVLEYEEGGNLRQWAAASPPDVAKVLEIGAALCSSLAAAHGEGIVHGDIKPDNVFVDHKGRLKLGDFGLAETGGAAAAAYHTPGYTAPELLRGEPPSPASDIFAVAALLHELGCGRTPPTAKTQRDQALAPLPLPLWNAITPALSPDPAQRPSAETFRTLLLATRDCLDTQPKPPRRSPVLVLAGLAAVIAALGAIYYLVESQSDPETPRVTERPSPSSVSENPGAAPPPVAPEKPTAVTPPPSSVAGTSPDSPTPRTEPPSAPPNSSASSPSLADKPAKLPTSVGETPPSEKGVDDDDQPPPGSEDWSHWNPDWKIVGRAPYLKDAGVHLSHEQDRGHGVLVIHPVDRSTPWTMTRTVTLPPDKPQQLLTRVGARWITFADWELRVYVGGAPAGPPQVISTKMPEGRFRAIAWDLSLWQGQSVEIRIEGHAGGKHPFAYEHGYLSEVTIEPLTDAKALRIAYDTTGLNPASTASVPLTLLPAKAQSLISKLAGFTQAEKANARRKIKDGRSLVAGRLRQLGGVHAAENIAEAKRIEALDPNADLDTPLATAAEVGKGIADFAPGTFTIDGLVHTLNADGSGRTKQGQMLRWRELSEGTGIVACWEEDMNSCNLLDLKGPTSNRATSYGVYGSFQRGSAFPAVESKYHRTIASEVSILRAADKAIREKRQQVLDVLRPTMTSGDLRLWERARLEIVTVSAGFYPTGTLEQLYELRGKWVSSMHTGTFHRTFEFQSGGALSVDGKVCGRWIWVLENSRRFVAMVYDDTFAGKTVPAAIVAEIRGNKMSLGALTGPRFKSIDLQP